MNVTQTYTRMHQALADAAKRGLVPHDIRVLVALYEHGSCTSERLSELLGEEDGSRSSAAVRRSLLKLYYLRLADGRGADGGPRRPGIVTRASLTESGDELAKRVVEAAL